MFDFAEWVFVVDTDSYSGNFERELAAYVAGERSEYGGEEFADMFLEDLGLEDDYDTPFSDILQPVSTCTDDCPVVEAHMIVPTPGYFNNGVGGHFKDGQEDEALEHKKKEELGRIDSKTVHPDDMEEHNERCKVYAQEPLRKYPAYQSVGIFFSQKPSDTQLAILKERALKFPEVYRTSESYLEKEVIKIECMRLLHFELKESEVESWKIEN